MRAVAYRTDCRVIALSSNTPLCAHVLTHLVGELLHLCIKRALVSFPLSPFTEGRAPLMQTHSRVVFRRRNFCAGSLDQQSKGTVRKSIRFVLFGFVPVVPGGGGGGMRQTPITAVLELSGLRLSNEGSAFSAKSAYWRLCSTAEPSQSICPGAGAAPRRRTIRNPQHHSSLWLRQVRGAASALCAVAVQPTLQDIEIRPAPDTVRPLRRPSWRVCSATRYFSALMASNFMSRGSFALPFPRTKKYDFGDAAFCASYTAR